MVREVRLARRLEVRGLDLAYWQLGGTQVGGTSRRLGAEESYGLLNRWTGPASSAHLQPCARWRSIRPNA